MLSPPKGQWQQAQCAGQRTRLNPEWARPLASYTGERGARFRVAPRPMARTSHRAFTPHIPLLRDPHARLQPLHHVREEHEQKST